MDSIITVELSGKERELKASVDAVRRLRARTGERLFAFIRRFSAQYDVDPADYAAIIHSGLSANKDTRLSYEDVEEAVFSAGITPLYETCDKFLAALISSPEGGEAGEGKL